VARTDGIADARHEIGYWVGQTHSLSFTPRSLRLLAEEPAGMLL
jgi:hypothetical protein